MKLARRSLERRGIDGAIRYSTGNFGKSLLESTFSLLYLFFLIDVVHLDPALAGTVLLASMLLDALFNPALGHAIDRWLRVFGSYQRIILIAAPFSAAFFALLFVLPSSVTRATGLQVFIATILFRAGCTLVDLPHNALLAGLTPDGRARVRLSTWRFFFSTLGNVIVLFGVAPALSASGSPLPAHFITPAIVISCIYAAVMVFSVTGTVARSSGPAAPSEVYSWSALLDLVRNARLLRILAVCVLSAGLVTVFMRGTVFYAKAGLGDAFFATYLVGAQMCGQLLGLPAWQQLASKTEKTTAAIVAQLLLAVSMGAFYVVSPDTLASALPLYFAMGVAVGGLTVMNWAIVPDTVEYTEAACGRRHEALTFGALLFLNKAASGFALALVGGVLAMIGYDSAASATSSGPLIAVMTIIPMIGALGSVIILAGTKLTYRDHQALIERA